MIGMFVMEKFTKLNTPKDGNHIEKPFLFIINNINYINYVYYKKF